MCCPVRSVNDVAHKKHWKLKHLCFFRSVFSVSLFFTTYHFQPFYFLWQLQRENIFYFSLATISVFSSCIRIEMILQGFFRLLAFLKNAKKIFIYFIFDLFFFFVSLQDLQSEIETHRVVYDRLDGTGRKLLGSLTSQEDAVMLQRRLDEMNQRWNHLKSKSIAIRWVQFDFVFVCLGRKRIDKALGVASGKSSRGFGGAYKIDKNLFLVRENPRKPGRHNL